MVRAWKLRRPRRDDRICGASFFVVLVFSRTRYFLAIPDIYMHTFIYVVYTYVYVFPSIYIFFSRVNEVDSASKTTPSSALTWDEVHFVSSQSEGREGGAEERCLLSCPRFLASSSLSSRHFQGSQYLPPVAPLPSAPHSVSLVFLSLPYSSLSLTASFLSLPLSLSLSHFPSRHSSTSYSRLVTTSSGTPFLCRTRSSTGIAARLKGQFRNFHSMASRSRLFSPRDRGRATDGTSLTAFQLRTTLIDDRNYPEEIPSYAI